MIHFESHSGIFTLETIQDLPISMAQAWDFFSSPSNLAKITPAKMGFRITSGEQGKMYSGQIITYKIGLFPGINTNWVTEIKHVEPFRFFIDEQRFGPYKMWHHEHHFEETEKGVVMRDKVSYKLPFGIFGSLAHTIFVKKQLREIFSFRTKILTDFFS